MGSDRKPEQVTLEPQLASHAGEQVKAPGKYGNKAHTPIEPAPGSYVKVKA